MEVLGWYVRQLQPGRSSAKVPSTSDSMPALFLLVAEYTAGLTILLASFPYELVRTSRTSWNKCRFVSVAHQGQVHHPSLTVAEGSGSSAASHAVKTTGAGTTVDPGQHLGDASASEEHSGRSSGQAQAGRTWPSEQQVLAAFLQQVVIVPTREKNYRTRIMVSKATMVYLEHSDIHHHHHHIRAKLARSI